jgi:Rod binding domain-containing protein
MSFGSLPPVDQSLLPAAVRNAPPARRSAYEAALGFEQLLVQQLTSSLADSAQSTFGGEDSPYAGMLPDALTHSVMDAGGLGLAPQLAAAIDPQDASSTRAGAGGAPSPDVPSIGSAA